MKKILFGAAVAAMAGAAYAAAITWNSGALKTLDDSGAFTSTQAKKGEWSGYVWLITQSEYETLADKYAADKNFDAVINTYKGKTDDATASGAITARSQGAVELKTDISDKGTYYAALLYKYGDSGYYIGNLATAVVDNADTPPTISQTGSLPFGDPANTDTAFTGGSTGASTPVVPDDPVDGPEPTSALLLLIGGSMLALKRKNA